MDFLEHLNPQQKKAVTAGSGPVLVLAGPGSGKTRVLTQRIAYLIANEGVRPYRILAVTFTNKAAREMQTRVEKLLGAEATQGMLLGTFHSISARLLRREAEHLQIQSNFVIFDADDQERLVKGIIKEFNLNDKLYRPGAVHASISNAKNELIGAADYPITNYRDEVVKRVYAEYQKRLVASNAVDFDDLLMYTARLLEEDPAVRDKYARRFEQVLVDEFQDTNLAQYTLLKHLASVHKNIFVVGDPDQCFPAGTSIQTPDGHRNIETLDVGETVIAAGGRGSILPSRIARIGKRHYDGELIRVTTVRGYSFRCTPNHIVFARLGLDPSLRMDRLYPQTGGPGIFRNVVKLDYFGDRRTTKEFPWYAHRVDLRSSELELAGELTSAGYHPRPQRGNSWQVGMSRLHYDDVQDVARKLSDAAGEAEIVVGAFLTGKQHLPSPERFSLMPAGHLHPAMILAVERDQEIVEDEIAEIRRVPYDGQVYDLEVENVHNYLAGDVVVHNSIYRWRGADWRNVQRFEEDYPEAQVILLEQNYRSRQTILDAAMGVIDRAQNRRRKHLFTERGAGERIYYYEAPDDYAEASFVVDSIAQLVASRDFEPGDCAVMYRTNAQSRLLEEAFLQARLPYRLVGAQRFYGRREVKDLIAFMRLVHNPADEASLDRILNVPPRGIGDKTLTALHLAARQLDTSAGLVLLDLAKGSDSLFWKQFTGRSAVPLADFGGRLADWRAAAPALSVSELFDRIVTDLHYKAYVDDESEEGQDRWENVQELRRLATEFSTRTLEEFLENIALVADQDTIQENVNAPTLLTLHAAKGLEFGAVFIVGLDDGIIPHSRSFDEPEGMEEERRLFYVGLTRAKDRLYLVRSVQRGGRGYAEETYPSRFLEDIPEGLLVGQPRAGRGLPGAGTETAWAAARSTSKSAPLLESRFRAGTRVRHKTWGDGIVLDSRIQDEDEIVDVVFESVGIKRLSAALANLSVI